MLHAGGLIGDLPLSAALHKQVLPADLELVLLESLFALERGPIRFVQQIADRWLARLVIAVVSFSCCR